MSVTPSPSGPDNIRDLQIKAQKAFSSGDYVNALRYFVEWSNSTPENHKAQERIAETLHKLGRTDKAISMYKKIAADYVAAGSLIKAIAIHKTILALNPEDEEIKQNLLNIFGNKVPQELKPTIPQAKGNKPVATAAKAQKGKKIAKDLTADDLGLGDLDELPAKEKKSAPAKPPVPPPPEMEINLKPAQEEMDELNTVFSDILGEDTELLEFSGGTKSDDPHDLFRRTPLFSDLKPQEMEILIDRLNLQNFPENHVICQEGEISEVMWIVVQGEVRIQTQKPDGTILPLATLGEGDFVGEGGLVTHRPRTASIIAQTDVTALEMTRNDFIQASNKHPNMRHVVETFYKNRLADRVMAQSELFGILPSFRRAELMQSIEWEEYKAHETILKGGDPESRFYLIQTGLVEIKAGPPGEKKVVEVLKPADFFGEVNMLCEDPPPFIALAKESCELLTLRKIEVEGIMQMMPEAEKLLKETAQLRKKKIEEFSK